jgi:hypothetical protein
MGGSVAFIVQTPQISLWFQLEHTGVIGTTPE